MNLIFEFKQYGLHRKMSFNIRIFQSIVSLLLKFGGSPQPTSSSPSVNDASCSAGCILFFSLFPTFFSSFHRSLLVTPFVTPRSSVAVVALVFRDCRRSRPLLRPLPKCSFCHPRGLFSATVGCPKQKFTRKTISDFQ